MTYQEECVGQVSVDKNRPANPASSSTPGGEDLRRNQSSNNSHKLVSGVGHQIQQLRIVVDAENVHGHLQAQDLKDDHCNRRGGNRAQKLWVEVPTESSQQYRQENVCHHSHNGDVHIGRVEIVSRGEEHGGVLLLDDLAIRSGSIGRHSSLLAGPGLVSPREEDEPDFVQDVGVRDVEVVLESGYGHIAIEL